MSEYQYYEFLAIDLPLDNRQVDELEKLSRHAEITATSLVSEYYGGDFHGDPVKLMEQYFDAFVYFANWGNRQLMFRLPQEVLDPVTADDYCYTDAASVRQTAGHVIIDLTVNPDDSNDSGEEPDPNLAVMAQVRSELAAGDLRLLYLGWLLSVQWSEVDDDDIEPPVPAGLGRLSGALRAVVRFLEIDAHLLTEAAKASPKMSARNDDTGFAQWVATLPASEKDALLSRVAEGEGTYVQNLMLHKFRASRPAADSAPGKRTAGQLLEAAEARGARHV